ncbi:putative HATPase_c domain protein [Polychaeton citri CBS 116435]|uniref:HATPase_c domain protein n=1 Tax=Polychaeton citri CBS 116435 TaxID=1314669 RepID=A0A9P4Q1L4_9PEZI|nr:putative HATPase_c domain protein [Polychaeton citri CBS 116435]
MAAESYARLREQTMGSLGDEEAVTVNTRALIDKVLARYSGEWTTLRELIQNAADAQASKVTIRFETQPSATVPLPSSQDPSQHLKHTLLHHTLRTLLVSNDGQAFGENDWSRLKRIAEGNPDETKIGAFGVGFYSVFADCETPFVSSGNQTMAFYWKKDSLFTRKGRQPDGQNNGDTTFLLDYRSQSTPVPPLLGLCQFLSTSLTFVGLECIDLYLDQWNILKLTKKMAPGMAVALPKELNPKTQGGLMKINGVEYQNAQIDAIWTNVVGWNKVLPTPKSDSSQSTGDANSGSLRSWFSKFTNTNAMTNSAKKRAEQEEEKLQQALFEDLAGTSRASVFLRISTVSIQTNVSRQLAQELERATKKPPPKSTRIAILTSSYDESSASLTTLSGASSQKASEIFATVLPSKNGRVFIGFPTAQTTGLLAHISAPSVIPTVERENIDLNARHVRDWNVEMLRVAGIACRVAYVGEMGELRKMLNRQLADSKSKIPSKDLIAKVMPNAVHAFKQYNFEESTPSSRVGQYIEEGFWTCDSKHSIDILSTRGVLPSKDVRVATEDLTFVEGIPVVPDELMDKATNFLTKLRDYGFLSDITTADIKKELEAQALSEQQTIELIKWACKKVNLQQMDSASVQTLFDGTVASISEEYVNVSSSPVIQLGQIRSFVNTARIPAELPTPPATIPFRLTKGISPGQLASIGWDELQIVPWLRYIVESDGRGFGGGQSFTTTPSVASQVLPVVSKSWDGLSQSSKQTVTDLLTPRTVVPTKLGMKVPAQAYFASVKLFDDLPTIVSLQGVKEKFLATLGVRKTVELNVVFERLMAKSTPGAAEEGKWSHVDLIKYLLSVQNDIPNEDMKRLRDTPICPAENRPGDKEGSGKLYRLCDLFEPNDAVRKLNLPLLQWPGPYRPNSAEGAFLKSLGLQPYPSVTDIVNILSTAPPRSELQNTALNYFTVNYFHNGYNRIPMAQIDKAFLPVLPFPGEQDNLIAKPRQCFANPKASILKFRILRDDLQPQHDLFGVAKNPPIDSCADRLIKQPPLDAAQAKALFGYFADRLNEIGPNGNLAQRLGEAPIVPILPDQSEKSQSNIRFVSPRSCFLGTGDTYRDIFDFVDFGAEANTFLLRVGSKHEPSAVEIGAMIVKQPARLLQTLGSEKYLQLLRKVAENVASIKKDQWLWGNLKSVPCLLAVKEIPQSVSTNSEKIIELDEDEEQTIKEYSLTSSKTMVLVDDFATYRLFKADLLAAPQEEVLEGLYSALDTPWLSKLVEDDQRMGALMRDQSSAKKLQKLIVERCRLFLHDHTSDVIRHDAKWIEQNMIVKTTEFLQVTRRLKGYRLQYLEKRTAALHRESRKDATLYITLHFDLYEVSRAIMSLLLKRPKQQDYLALEMLMESDLRRLKTKGYNVDRILRQKAIESRIAESERLKREEEQRKMLEAEAATRPAPPPHTVSTPVMANGKKQLEIETPERAPPMPGAFTDSPEQLETSSKGKRPNNIFSNLSKQLGFGGRDSQSEQQMQNMMGNRRLGPPGEDSDVPPPPYDYQEPKVLGTATSSGTQKVTSPRELQRELESAIKATRPHGQNHLFSPPTTRTINESTSYCDSTHAHNLSLVGDIAGRGVRLFLPSNMATPQRTFVDRNVTAITYFTNVLHETASIFDLPVDTLNIFYNETGSEIAFNSNGSIFCNLRFFQQLHEAQIDTPEGLVEAMAYWWITLCHELAHNLVKEHSSQHSFYTESFVTHYFRRMVWWVSRHGS